MNVHAHTIYNIGAKVIISCQTTKYKRFFSVQKFEFLTNFLSDESTLKSQDMRKKGGIINAQPLPSLVGEGLGWGQYLSHRQDITDPAPPLDGRGVAAPSCATCPDFLKWTQWLCMKSKTMKPRLWRKGVIA